MTPQGKIIADFIVAEAGPDDGGGFFLDCPRASAPALKDKLNFYKLRAKVTVDDLSEPLGVMAVWDGDASERIRAVYRRSAPAGARQSHHLPPDLATEAATDLGAKLSDAEAYDAHRIALGVPRGGEDFIYGDAFPHEADMDQLGGVDFDKGCYVGQEVVSRIEHRGTARSRIVPVAYEGFAPAPASPVMAGEKAVGTLDVDGKGRGLALVRLDRVADALAAGHAATVPAICRSTGEARLGDFAWPGKAKAS